MLRFLGFFISLIGFGICLSLKEAHTAILFLSLASTGMLFVIIGIIIIEMDEKKRRGTND